MLFDKFRNTVNYWNKKLRGTPDVPVSKPEDGTINQFLRFDRGKDGNVRIGAARIGEKKVGRCLREYRRRRTHLNRLAAESRRKNVGN